MSRVKRNYAPPKKRWAKKAVRRPGKLGGKGFITRSFEDQKRILRSCVRKYGYRSCLGSIMFLHNITNSTTQKVKARKLKDWLVREYGGPGSFKKNPSDGSWVAVREILKCKAMTEKAAMRSLTEPQVEFLTWETT